jgi:hypothetical protein
MSNIKIRELLHELELALIQKHATILDRLNPGKSIEELKQIFKGMDIPEEVYAIFQWKNGVDTENRPIGQSWLFSMGALMKAEDAVRCYCHFVNSDEYWIDGMFPVFRSLGGEFYLVDTNKGSPTFGFVFLYYRAAVDFETIISMYDSLETLSTSVTECFKTGAYSYNKDGILVMQHQLAREIEMKNNPRSAYWTLFK